MAKRRSFKGIHVFEILMTGELRSKREDLKGGWGTAAMLAPEKCTTSNFRCQRR
jgi:hypothetical protein